MGKRHRRPAGCLEGGQFAPTRHDESAVGLTGDRGLPDDIPGPIDVDRAHPAGVRFAPDVVVTGAARALCEQAAMGVGRLADRSDSRWTIGSLGGDQTAIDFTVDEESTGERFLVTLSPGTVSVISEQNWNTFWTTVLFRADPATTLEANLANTARWRRRERAADSVASDVPLGPGTVLDNSSAGTPVFTNGGESFRIQPCPDNTTDLTVTTECVHPITGLPVVDTYQARMADDGTLRLELDAERPRDVPPTTTARLSDWMDQISGGEGFLWYATHANHVARSWPDDGIGSSPNLH